VTAARRVLLVIAALSVLALLASARIDRDEASRFAARTAIASALVQLGTLAGVRDESGAVTLRPLPVAAALEGGPLWLRDELEAGIEADPAFELADSPNLVRVEVVGSEHAYGLAAALFRQGWNLRLPRPVRVRVAPWVSTVSVVLGLLVAFGVRRLGIGLAVTGIAAQLTLSWLPWEVPLTPASWGAAVREGPLGVAVVDWARGLPAHSLAIGVGVVVLCAILMYFDHRRSRSRGGLLLVGGIAGTVGLLLWAEAAARAGALGWGRTTTGVLALCILAVAWAVLARYQFRQRRR
jgi:hypothetical protein